MHSAKFVVGVARLELAALRSRTVRATKLRYTPFVIGKAIFDCHCNIHQISYFCNKNKSIISKNMFCGIFFSLIIKNRLQIATR